MFAVEKQTSGATVYRFPYLPRTLALLAALLLAACESQGAVAPTAALRPTLAPTTAPSSVPTAAPPPTAAVEQRGEVAPGEPATADTWTSGVKLGVGTAFTYDQPPGDANPSRVWFAITDGAITEGLYPDISTANLKSLHLLVSDGKSFVADEMRDATYAIERLDGRTPAFRVTSTDKQGRWAATKQVVADPQANTILFTVTFQALQGRPEDYHLYLIYTPRVGNDGAGDLSSVRDGIAEAWDERAGAYAALAASPTPALISAGYTHKNDLAVDLAPDYRVDATYIETTQPGRLSIGMELPTVGASSVALGFGKGREDARAAATGSLARGFEAVAQSYMQGWAGYLDALVHPYPNLPLYDESLAAIKTHEDKNHYGAFVASVAVPWGHTRADTADERGYRYVWPRDLYHAAMALYVAGDVQSARDALALLDDVIQKGDGSFPQNTAPDGTPHWTALQLDQVANPIILAWHLKAGDRYASLVKPAADFILAHGPATQQDRWEENAGYSPATLAAEIAGLVCAADLARQAGDAAGAERYLAIADRWNSNIEKWTLTTSGPLGKGTYYLRISDGVPNSPTQLTLANGGGSHDQRAIVDQSFLELVRLGVRKANDPNILATLEVTDAELEVKTPKGEAYRRYQHDGYGESALGQVPDGHGQLWPLLLGEHSIYEVAQTGSEHPASWYLPVMSSYANAGGMLPEQVFADGSGTGSATPLVWAHAEFVLFANAVKQGKVVDMPAVVAERYAK
jgi:glucoamylase